MINLSCAFTLSHASQPQTTREQTGGFRTRGAAWSEYSSSSPPQTSRLASVCRLQPFPDTLTTTNSWQLLKCLDPCNLSSEPGLRCHASPSLLTTGRRQNFPALIRPFPSPSCPNFNIMRPLHRTNCSAMRTDTSSVPRVGNVCSRSFSDLGETSTLGHATALSNPTT